MHGSRIVTPLFLNQTISSAMFLASSTASYTIGTGTSETVTKAFADGVEPSLKPSSGKGAMDEEYGVVA